MKKLEICFNETKEIFPQCVLDVISFVCKQSDGWKIIKFIFLPRLFQNQKPLFYYYSLGTIFKEIDLNCP
jgi:hypothetical protein